MSASAGLQAASGTGQPTVNKPVGSKTITAYFLLTLAGVYATGGDTLDLAAAFNSPGMSLPVASLPLIVKIRSIKPTSSAQTNLFEYNYVPGTTLQNGKVQVFTGAAAQTALTELSAGAYPAGVLADVIEIEAVFPSM